MAVKIKLKRMGKIRAPFYRIIVADARTKRDGRAIEEIGKYHPKVDPSLIEVDSERAQYWLSVGAQPTDPVRRLLEITGDWQKFKGLPGAEGTLKTAAAKPDKKDAFAAAVAETVKEIKVKGKAAEPKAAGAKAADGKGTDGKAGEPKADKGADRGRGRKQGGSGDKASAGKAAEDSAVKDGAAKDSAAKDSAAKDAAPKADAEAKETTGKDAADGAAAEPEVAVAAAGSGTEAASQDGEA